MLRNLKEELKNTNHTIVFPEGSDTRIIEAAMRVKNENLGNPLLVVKTVAEAEEANNYNLETIVIENNPILADMVAVLVEARKGKLTEEDAWKLVMHTNYFAVMLVKMERADCFLGGVEYSTGDILRPALQILKTRPDTNLVSSFFVMTKNDKVLIMSDCAVNVNPTAEQLAQIAIQTEQNSKMFLKKEPIVAMLSFSTDGSANTEESLKVRMATELIDRPNFFGEVQFDAAVVPSVAKQKYKKGEFEGNANVFIFPDLNAGNIGYKIAQRFGGYQAIGPVLQGISKPVNDLSRGADTDDVFNMAVITLSQSINWK